MKSIRSGSGLGDSIYLQSAVRHLAQQEPIEVLSNWPDVFRPLGKRVTVSPFRRDHVDIRAHYVMRKAIPHTDQFQDVCIAAGIRSPVEFKLGWVPRNQAIARRVRGDGAHPVIAVQLPRRPFDRTDGFGAELLPNCAVIQSVIDRIGKRARFVLVGKGDALYPFNGIDLDLSNQTSVSDLLDVAASVDGFLGYVSFFVPLAESMNKPALFVWSRRGLDSPTPFLNQITPRKILHRATSHAVIDDEPDEATVDQFLAAVTSGRAVSGQAGGTGRVRARGLGQQAGLHR